MTSKMGEDDFRPLMLVDEYGNDKTIGVLVKDWIVRF
jgi:hypothetical protein